MFLIIRAGAAAATLLSLPLFAAEGPAPLGNTIVTATRTEVDRDDVLAPVIVITREELQRSLAPDVASLLQFHAGIDVARNGGPGQTTTVFIRGAESNHTTVLVDGVRINPGTIGGAQLQNITPEAIERIEIVKGPRSALYGTDAIGGVINIITRTYSSNGIDASTGYGSYETWQAAVSGGIGGAGNQLAFSANWLDSTGFPTRTFDDTDRGYENHTFTVKGRTQLGAVNLGARYWQANGTSEYSDFFVTPVDQDFENSTAAVDVAFQPAQHWNSRVTASRIMDDIEQNQSDDRVRTRRNTLDWQNDVSLGEHQQLTAGVQLMREQVDTLEFGSVIDEDTDSDMVFVQDRVSFGRHDLLFAAAWVDHSTFGDEVTWNAEYGVDVGSSTRLIGSAGTGFRAPDATDRFGSGGNPDLDPESSRNYELGVQQRIGGHHRLRLSAFRNDIDDLITFVFTDPINFIGENENVERARIEGVELAYEYQAASWRVRAEAIAQNPRNLTTDSQLLRRAKESLTVSLAKAFGAHEIGIDALITGEREDFGVPDPVVLDGYALVNLYGRFAITGALSIQARIENALDEQYQLASTYNTPDRSLFVAMKYQWK